MEKLPQKHDILWFSDGSVVLATDTLLFRVHKTVLSLHSTVFKDTFDLPFIASVGGEERTSIMDGNTDIYEGLSMVQLLGDKGEDVAHLLRAMYEPGYYDRADDSTPLDKITAFLVLSGKYDVAKLRADVIKQLSRKYPTTLKEYEVEEGNEMLFGRPRDECHFPLLRAALATSLEDIQTILLMLYYACSTQHITIIMNYERQTLAYSTLDVLLPGKNRIEKEILNVLNFVADTHNTSLTNGCPFQIVDGQQNMCSPLQQFPPSYLVPVMAPIMSISSLEGSKIVEAYFERSCKRCRDSVIRTVDDRRNQIWLQVPSFFGF